MVTARPSRSTAPTSGRGCPAPGTAVPGLLRDLHEAGVALASIEVVRPTLDDVFLTLTGRSLRDAEATPETTADPTPEEK